jgi:hypothetical protein
MADLELKLENVVFSILASFLLPSLLLPSLVSKRNPALRIFEISAGRTISRNPKMDFVKA